MIMAQDNPAYEYFKTSGTVTQEILAYEENAYEENAYEVIHMNN